MRNLASRRVESTWDWSQRTRAQCPVRVFDLEGNDNDILVVFSGDPWLHRLVWFSLHPRFFWGSLCSEGAFATKLLWFLFSQIPSGSLESLRPRSQGNSLVLRERKS